MRIVFFDGECNLCNTWIDFLVRRNARKSIRFASLQGTTARKILGPDSPRARSVVFLDEDRVFTNSDAVLKVFSCLSLPWRGLVLFKLVPRVVRDGVYEWIAQNRFHWFGKRETCRSPQTEERSWFLE